MLSVTDLCVSEVNRIDFNGVTTGFLSSEAALSLFQHKQTFQIGHVYDNNAYAYSLCLLRFCL